MKLKLILLVLILCSSSAVYGQFEPNALVFEMKDGSSVAFLYDEQPVLKFTDTDIVVKIYMNEMSYPQSAVRKYVFAYCDTGSINSPKKDEGIVNLKGDYLMVSNLKAGAKVALVSVDGKILAVDFVDTSGNCKINLSTFLAGVYLLNYSNVSVKIVKP